MSAISVGLLWSLLDSKLISFKGQVLFWGQKWAWWFTAVMFILNNTFIQGFHVRIQALLSRRLTNFHFHSAWYVSIRFRCVWTTFRCPDSPTVAYLFFQVGAKYLNTMTNHSVCTVGFSAIMAVISWICSMPRVSTTTGFKRYSADGLIFDPMQDILCTIQTGYSQRVLHFRLSHPSSSFRRR